LKKKGEGKRASIEIGSWLSQYCDEVAASSNSGNHEITFYSDNCGGQGKNKFVTAAYPNAVTKFKIHSIAHKYLVVGHTQ
jgi:hypothetical protein